MVEFGSGLIGYLTIGFTTLLAMAGNGTASPGPVAWGCGAGVLLLALAAAAWLSLRRRRRGIFAGALVALAIIAIVAGCLLLLLRIDATRSR